MVTPKDDAEDWRPDKPVRVEAKGGRLTAVTVRTADGDEITGAYGEGGRSWVARWTMSPDTRYEVSATAVNPDGRKATVRTSFTTLEPESTIDITSVNAAGGDSYGVGLPIVVTFDKPVDNEKRVERSLELRASEPITGAWHWMSSQEVHFRPRKHWPTDTKVRLIAHFDGVRAAKDTYGIDNVDAKFTIGDKRVTKINTKTHTMKVYENGDRIKTVPISAGRPGYPTTSGTHVVFQRAPLVIMDSATVGIPEGSPGYYRLKVKWTVKFSFSGLYTHSAPWSIGAQGNTNVSHGCVNMPPDAAKWYYKLSRVGDIIKITGTPRDLEWGNGWTDWEMPFEEYLEGSATGEPVTALTMEGEPHDGQSPANASTAQPTTPPTP